MRSWSCPILLAIYAAVGHGVQGFRGLESVSAMILCCALFISGAMVEEGMASPQCVAVEESSKGDVQGKPDGRACKLPEDCQGESAEEGVIYRCEQVGGIRQHDCRERPRALGGKAAGSERDSPRGHGPDSAGPLHSTGESARSGG